MHEGLGRGERHECRQQYDQAERYCGEHRKVDGSRCRGSKPEPVSRYKAHAQRRLASADEEQIRGPALVRRLQLVGDARQQHEHVRAEQ